MNFFTLQFWRELPRRLRRAYVSLPRWSQWSAIFLLFVVLPYFTVVEWALDNAGTTSAQANLLQESLTRQASRAERAEGAGQSLALGQARFGGVKFPGESKQVESLLSRIDEVLKARGAGSPSKRERPPAQLGRDVMAGVVPEGMQVQRVQVQVDFEASQQAAAAIIADLERTPEVHAISRASLKRLDRDGKRLVQAQLVIDTWIVAAKSGGGAKS